MFPQRQAEMAIVLDHLAARGHRRQRHCRLGDLRHQGLLPLVGGLEQRQRRVA
jgi:hypothetical protein